MIGDYIKERLFALRDEDYRDFQGALIPTVPRERMTGVRTPELRALAKELSAREDIGDFLADLPHRCFEEDQLHAFVISGMKDFGACVDALGRFLPFVDNWATCDQMSPGVFRKHRAELAGLAEEWIASGKTYIVRFGIKALMDHFLDDDFDPRFPELVSGVDAGEYYVSMMAAWYFATALAKQYDAVLPYLTERRLDPATHDRAIRKAVESRRISPERKEFLRALRRK